ncbi:cytochrome P450 (plasmid) [Streptomyces sp. NBC_01724]|uniref:cytochrome P450 family protein n=1 Tax=Streptomyces sp. NBC_01724 TaxID=2975922 RepID=UPI002E3024B5|nr:cytochrome P450 [Streptomyces sp. NBC_01724]
MDSQASINPATCPFINPAPTDLHKDNRDLRDRGPATLVRLPGEGNVLAWVITDQNLAWRLMDNDDVSKDASLHWPAYKNGQIPEDWPLRIWVDVRNALSTYGDEHSRLRGLIEPFFRSRRVRALIPDIEHITSTLLDELEKHPPGPVDLRAHYAWKLPLSVINVLLGLPEEMTDALRHHVEAGMSTHYSPAEATANAAAYYGLLKELVEVKRASPGDDVTSYLIKIHDEHPERLSDDELLDSLMLVIGAGHQTTADLLDQAITNLLRHPDQLHKVLSESDEASWDDVVNETLRHESPAANIPFRFAVNDIHDDTTGITIPQGAVIIINVAALGRDPKIHSDPDVFDVTRKTRKKHTGFGHGVHFCPGAELARLEGRIALSSLFTRFPELAFADPTAELPPLGSFISNGHQNLPVYLTHP